MRPSAPYRNQFLILFCASEAFECNIHTITVLTILQVGTVFESMPFFRISSSSAPYFSFSLFESVLIRLCSAVNTMRQLKYMAFWFASFRETPRLISFIPRPSIQCMAFTHTGMHAHLRMRPLPPSDWALVRYRLSSTLLVCLWWLCVLKRHIQPHKWRVRAWNKGRTSATQSEKLFKAMNMLHLKKSGWCVCVCVRLKLSVFCA